METAQIHMIVVKPVRRAVQDLRIRLDKGDGHPQLAVRPALPGEGEAQPELFTDILQVRQVLADEGEEAVAQIEGTHLGKGIRQVLVDRGQGLVHLGAAEDLAVLIVVLQDEAEDAAGAPPAYALGDQCLEGGEVIDITVIGHVQVRVEEGQEDDDDRHEAEGVHDEPVREEEPHIVSDQQDHLDGDDADDLMGCQLLPVEVDGEQREPGIGGAAGVEQVVHGARVEPVVDIEHEPREGRDHRDDREREEHDRGIAVQFRARDVVRVQHADRENEEHVGPGNVKK